MRPYLMLFFPLLICVCKSVAQSPSADSALHAMVPSLEIKTSLSNRNPGGHLQFGVRGGLSLSNMVGDKGYTTQPSGNTFSLDEGQWVPGYSVGGIARYSLFPFLSLEAEINLSSKGQRHRLKGVLNEQAYDIVFRPKLTYLGVPIVIQYHPVIFQSVAVYAGVAPAWLLSAKQKVKGDFDRGTEKITSSFKRSDLGLIVGFNVALRPDWWLDLRFEDGVKDVSFPDEYTYVSNKSFLLGIQYIICK